MIDWQLSVIQSFSYQVIQSFNQKAKVKCRVTVHILTSVGLLAYRLIKNSNSTNLFIEFSNGSIIYFNSAVQGDDIRGMTVEKGILVIDEAAYIDSDFYNEVCTPFVDFHKELTVLVSTPEYRQGFFYENYMASLGTPYSINFSDYDLGVIRSHERLEGIRLAPEPNCVEFPNYANFRKTTVTDKNHRIRMPETKLKKR